MLRATSEGAIERYWGQGVSIMRASAPLAAYLAGAGGLAAGWEVAGRANFTSYTFSTGVSPSLIHFTRAL